MPIKEVTPLTFCKAIKEECPHECLCVDAVERELDNGDKVAAIRAIRQGTRGCEEDACTYGLLVLEQRLLGNVRDYITEIWQAVFPDGGMRIRFVCHSQPKMHALKEAMALSDVVPMNFNLATDQAAGTIEVVVEI
jgi:hypothetical protein